MRARPTIGRDRSQTGPEGTIGRYVTVTPAIRQVCGIVVRVYPAWSSKNQRTVPSNQLGDSW